MKRLHVHLTVPDLEKGIRFYNTLFDAEPAVAKDDYAKWMLDDPAVNFAISNFGEDVGVNHLGFQFDTDEEVATMQARLDQAKIEGKPEEGALCCYAYSNKYWTMDTAGIPWENFHTMDVIETYNGEEKTKSNAESSAGAHIGCGCSPVEQLKDLTQNCCQ